MSNIFSALLYYLVIKPVSLLPFPLLYLFSDFFFVILFYVFPYRKKLVTDNLRRSFPEKSDAEINRMRREFYRHFCDLVVETLKLFSAKPKTISRRVRVLNAELLEKYYSQGKSIMLVSGHFANWEWPASVLSLHSSYRGSGMYKKLSNSFFDKKLRSTRAAFGTDLFTNANVNEFIESNKKNMYLFGFINDQSPSNPKSGHWMKFLNQDTLMLFGAEKYAVMYDLPVLYGVVRKIRRGHYTLEYVHVTDNPASEKKYFITEQSARINEDLIKSKPEYWLWTHRRWKHKFIEN